MLPEELLLGSFIRENHDRYVRSWACAIIAFHFRTAEKLTASERLKAISATAPGVSGIFLRPYHGEYSHDWLVFSDAPLKIDLAPTVCDVKERLVRLLNVKSMAVSDPEILSGTPVIAGTELGTRHRLKLISSERMRL